MTLNVLKFGGTSVANHPAMMRCAGIVSQDADNRLVVVSASAGVTNALSQLGKGLAEEERTTLIQSIRDIQTTILTCLPAASQTRLKAEIDTILEQINSLSATIFEHGKNPILKDSLLAKGELMSSHLFAEVLTLNGNAATFLDARRFMETNEAFGKAEVNIKALQSKLQSILAEQPDTLFVTQGFIGATDEGQTTTLGRGGSDYSAALMAEAAKADRLEIWTDVPGLYTTDPRLVSDASPIGSISFPEAAEMATFGAKILHPKTLWPAVRANIPVFVGSSREPEQGGTLIQPASDCPQTHHQRLTALAVRNDQIVITLTSLDMLHSFGFLAKAFQVLANHQVSVDLVTTSEVSIAITLDDPDRTGAHIPKGLINDLEQLGEVKISRDLALIALIGSGLDSQAGLAGEIFSAIKHIPVRLICHGASEHNLCFLVDQNNAAETVRIIHQSSFHKTAEQAVGETS